MSSVRYAAKRQARKVKRTNRSEKNMIKEHTKSASHGLTRAAKKTTPKAVPRTIRSSKSNPPQGLRRISRLMNWDRAQTEQKQIKSTGNQKSQVKAEKTKGDAPKKGTAKPATASGGAAAAKDTTNEDGICINIKMGRPIRIPLTACSMVSTKSIGFFKKGINVPTPEFTRKRNPSPKKVPHIKG